MFSILIVVDRGSGTVESGIGKGIISVLLPGVPKVVRAVTIAIEVVCEQPSTTSGRSHHTTSVMAHVHQVDSVAVATTWIIAGSWEGLDEVEKSLIAITSCGSWATGRRIVAQVLCATSIGDLLALVVRKNR